MSIHLPLSFVFMFFQAAQAPRAGRGQECANQREETKRGDQTTTGEHMHAIKKRKGAALGE
jgi:hypothetical protein